MMARRLGDAFRRFAPLMILPLTVGLLGAGCSGPSPEPASRTDAATLRSSVPRVRVAAALPTSEGGASFATYLEAEREAELVAETDGDIFEIRVVEGQRVEQGDTLLIIDDRDERLALQRDEAERAWALSQLNRAQALDQQGHVAAREVEQARLQLDRAEAALGLSQVALSRCAVRAPIAGLAWMIRVQPLHRVVVGQPLLRVTDPYRLRASAYLPSAFRGAVRPGTRVRLEPARGGAPIEATVSRVDPLTDPASGTFKVVATFRSRSARRPGSFCRCNPETRAAPFRARRSWRRKAAPRGCGAATPIASTVAWSGLGPRTETRSKSNRAWAATATSSSAPTGRSATAPSWRSSTHGEPQPQASGWARHPEGSRGR